MPEGERPLAIVTGGGQGIGRAVVQHYHDLGWRVAAFDKDGEALSELDDQLGERLFSYAADMGRAHEVARAFAALAEWTGSDGTAPKRIALLVNNSGIADPVSGPIEQLDPADWQRWIDASLTAAYLCTRLSVPGLRAAGGAIVNIGSTRAVMSEPDCEAYAAAKGGLNALTHALAISLGPDVRVNAVMPGWIETGPWQKAAARRRPDHRQIDHEQHPAGRVGVPGDVVRAIEWLAGDGAAFVTGQAIAVDGGMTVKMIYAD